MAAIITTVAMVEVIMKTTVEAKLQNLLPGQLLSYRNYFQNRKRTMISIFYCDY